MSKEDVKKSIINEDYKNLESSIRSVVQESLFENQQQLNENKNVKKYLKIAKIEGIYDTNAKLFLDPKDANRAVLFLSYGNKDFMVEFDNNNFVDENQLRSGETDNLIKKYKNSGWIENDAKRWVASNIRLFMEGVSIGLFSASIGAAILSFIIVGPATISMASDGIDWLYQKVTNIYGSFEPTKIEKIETLQQRGLSRAEAVDKLQSIDKTINQKLGNIFKGYELTWSQKVDVLIKDMKERAIDSLGRAFDAADRAAGIKGTDSLPSGSDVVGKASDAVNKATNKIPSSSEVLDNLEDKAKDIDTSSIKEKAREVANSAESKAKEAAKSTKEKAEELRNFFDK